MRKIVFLNIYSQIFIFEKCKKIIQQTFFFYKQKTRKQATQSICYRIKSDIIRLLLYCINCLISIV